jgi:hypothetical protein
MKDKKWLFFYSYVSQSDAAECGFFYAKVTRGGRKLMALESPYTTREAIIVRAALGGDLNKVLPTQITASLDLAGEYAIVLGRRSIARLRSGVANSKAEAHVLADVLEALGNLVERQRKALAERPSWEAVDAWLAARGP